MKRESVDSSMIRSIGYGGDEHTLEIEFNHGGIYEYYDVPVEEYEALMSADSHGRHFLYEIKSEYAWGRVK